MVNNRFSRSYQARVLGKSHNFKPTQSQYDSGPNSFLYAPDRVHTPPTIEKNIDPRSLLPCHPDLPSFLIRSITECR